MHLWHVWSSFKISLLSSFIPAPDVNKSCSAELRVPHNSLRFYDACLVLSISRSTFNELEKKLPSSSRGSQLKMTRGDQISGFCTFFGFMEAYFCKSCVVSIRGSTRSNQSCTAMITNFKLILQWTVSEAGINGAYNPSSPLIKSTFSSGLWRRSFSRPKVCNNASQRRIYVSQLFSPVHTTTFNLISNLLIGFRLCFWYRARVEEGKASILMTHISFVASFEQIINT